MSEDQPTKKKRFSILVCIDGSEESYQGLKEAALFGRGIDADIILMYARLIDQGLHTGGLQMNVIRGNILEWDMDIPGIRYLKKGRQLLLELGNMSVDWEETVTHQNVAGDPLGDHFIQHTNRQGKRIGLKLRTTTDIAQGIIDQQMEYRYDLVVLGGYGRRSLSERLLGLSPMASKVVREAGCSVAVMRPGPEDKQGYLIVVDGSDRGMATVDQTAIFIHRSGRPITLVTIAQDETEISRAQEQLDKVRERLSLLGVQVKETMFRVGDPEQEVLEAGRSFSATVLAAPAPKGQIARLFQEDVVYRILEKSDRSVFLVRSIWDI
ncbi:MAG: universal stress protein, partial [Magnetococcales bacterium]|nr:universal stress protein [Magnetococcales bacterium]